jgi:hypothetical protein
MENQENSKVLESRIYTEAEKNLIVEILKLRTSSLVSYSNRVWLIFNWFITFNLSFFAFFFTFKIDCYVSNVVLIAGFLINGLWLLIGINDYFSMKKHKEIKEKIEVRVAEILNIQNILLDQKPKYLKYNQTKTLFIIPILTSLFWLFFLVMKLFKF